MLYLTSPADAALSARRRVPIGENTALHLERILLTRDRRARQRELAQLLANDRDIAGWALHAAEFHLGRTINRIEQAADWLGDCLETQLAAALGCDESGQQVGHIEWRLPALVATLNDYQRKLGDFQQQLEHEKLESLKELAYGASHEINNPLANIAARAQTLLEGEADPERGRKLSAIRRQAMRAHEMIADLMLFARPPKLNLTPCDLRQLACRVVDELRDLADEFAVELDCEAGDEPLEIVADETQLGVALHAVVKNALEAAADGGHVWVSMRQIEHAEVRSMEITVRDDGPGISDEVRQHIFDPFFCGREAGRGLGFGLSKCWRIINDHGGQVVVNRPCGGGAEIGIQLPLTD